MEHSPLRPYICYYKNMTAEVQAETSYKAQLEAAKILNVPPRRQYQITVMLADVVHSTSEI